MNDVANDRPDPVRELLLPYVLGELSDADRERVDERLEQDASLRDELAQIERTSVELLTAWPQREAPAAIKARVLDAVGVATRHDARIDAGQRRARTRAARSSRWSEAVRRYRLVPAFSGALAAASVVLLVLFLDTRSSLDETRAELLQATANSGSQTQDAAAKAGSQFVVDTSDQLAVARGKLVRTGDEWMLVFENVPAPGDGSTWQVWTADKAGAISNVAQWSGDETTRVLMIEDAEDIDEVMISHEHSMAPMEAPSGKPMAQVST